MTQLALVNYHGSVNRTATLVECEDYLNGFDQNLFSSTLDQLVKFSRDNNIININLAYVCDIRIQDMYPDINFQYQQRLVGGRGWEELKNYNVHPALGYKNFICSFNGSKHVSRILLVSILHKFKYFNPEYCSKNFSYSSTKLDGLVHDYLDKDTLFYNKFFLDPLHEDFFQTINSFGHVRFNHNQNIYNLENKLTESFLHIVSETMATSYYPFVTEKFLYSIVTRGLFLSYAQPGWHAHLEKYYGFKKYTKLFDYRFDLIQNPVERLVELMTMVSKFSTLSVNDWRDLYLLEQDTIEYNYNHYFSGDYLDCLKEYE